MNLNMGKVVNLNKVRKLKARAEQAEQAAENRARFGRTKAQKALDLAASQEMQRKLDQLRRDSPERKPD